MKQKKTIGRVIALAMVLLLLASALAACSSSKADYEWESGEDRTTYFARILALNTEAREAFTAARWGLDIDTEREKTPDYDNPAPVNVEAAKKALDKVTPKDAEKFNAYKSELDGQAVIDIVERMKQNSAVDLKEATFPGILLVWIGKFLQVITNLIGGNYVFGLFIFAILIEALMLPFGIKQQKNSIKQAKMSPKERAIRKKYAGRNDQVSMRKMQEEIQRLYQEEGFNPMGGCLPLLIQLPIVIVLYNIVIDPLRYVLGKPAGLSGALSTYCTTAPAAGGLGLSLGDRGGTIELLSKLNAESIEGMRNFSYFSNSGACADALKGITVPNFNLFGENMGQIPGFHQPWLLLLIPVLTFVLYFFSMKLNRKFSYQPAVTDPQMGCSNKMMDITMPLMSVYITFIVPAAVGIYWMFKCVLSTVKQFVIHKLMPMPVFTEEDYKAAEKAIRGKARTERAPAGTMTTSSGRVVRSLHHIDDEDDLPPRVTQAREEKTSTAKKGNNQSSVSRAPLKDDRKNGQNKKK